MGRLAHACCNTSSHQADTAADANRYGAGDLASPCIVHCPSTVLQLRVPRPEYMRAADAVRSAPFRWSALDDCGMRQARRWCPAARRGPPAWDATRQLVDTELLRAIRQDNALLRAGVLTHVLRVRGIGAGIGPGLGTTRVAMQQGPVERTSGRVDNDGVHPSQSGRARGL